MVSWSVDQDQIIKEQKNGLKCMHKWLKFYLNRIANELKVQGVDI